MSSPENSNPDNEDPDNDEDQSWVESQQETQRWVDEILGKGETSLPQEDDRASGSDNKVDSSFPSNNTFIPGSPGFLNWGDTPEKKPNSPSSRSSGFFWADPKKRKDAKATNPNSSDDSKDAETDEKKSNSWLEEQRKRREQERLDREAEEAKKKEEAKQEKLKKIEEIRKKVTRQEEKIRIQKNELDQLNQKIAAKRATIDGIDYAMSITDDSQTRSELGSQLADARESLTTLRNRKVDVNSKFNEMKSSLSSMTKQLESLNFDLMFD